ncbi:DUF2939 domain-containing protein [Bradyrhizobium sp. 62B]|uniref:DUF2939 domain-containing protein n=1 Tax=Bradyrhizobium sp. 62B TaxID=2898442 RepID=UPI002557F3D3|nr:DUF2939 domain-containing protein [Bradyrhizobium sp. 62B]
MRWFFGSLVALLVCLGIYIGSAIVSLGGLVQAVKVRDSAEVIARTDTARVRRSLVDQIVAAYLKQIGRERPVKPLERLAANNHGASVADAMIAKMFTPENLMAVLSKGAISVGGADASMRGLTDIDTTKVFDTLKRVRPTKAVESQILVGEAENEGSINRHFEGSGRKLSGIQLPTAAVQVLAQNLARNAGRNDDGNPAGGGVGRQTHD